MCIRDSQLGQGLAEAVDLAGREVDDGKADHVRFEDAAHHLQVEGAGFARDIVGAGGFLDVAFAGDEAA